MAVADDAGGALEKLLAVSQEQLRWQRAAALPDVRKTIEATLSRSKERRAYEMLDGATAAADIAKAVGVSEATLSRWARRWRDLGIAYESPGPGRRTHHLISLEDLGLSLDAEEG